MKCVLYHDNCPDGFTAAWAAWRKFGDDGVDYVGVNYGQEPPLDIARDADIYLVDFSYSRAVMDRISSVAKSVTVFDHHKTAEAELRGWPGGRVVFDMNRSGAGITWDELHGKPRPRVVDYAEDIDLWRFALPHAREVREVIFLTERTFPAWNGLDARLTYNFERAVEIGEWLLQAKRVRVAKVCENVRWMTFIASSEPPLRSVRVPVVNASWDMSEIGEHLCEKFPEAPAGGYYFDRHDKRQWGFRSRGGFDVSALCKAYGGGGHAAAAGFESKIGWEPDKETP